MKCSSCGWESIDGAEFCVNCGKSLPVTKRCFACGTLNFHGATRCGNCGAALLASVAEEASDLTSAKKCKWCGNVVGDDEDVCQECLSRSKDTKVHVTFKKKKPSRRLTVCAIYLMLSGMAAVGFGLLLIFLHVLIVESFGFSTGVGTCGSVIALFGLVSVAGGTMAIRRKHFILVLLGSIFSLLSLVLIFGALLGFLGVFLGVPFGLIGIVLLTPTQHEFGM